VTFNLRIPFRRITYDHPGHLICTDVIAYPYLRELVNIWC